MIDDEDEVERRIMSINDPQVFVIRTLLLAILAEAKAWWQLDKVAERVVSDGDEVEDALEDGCAGLWGGWLRVELSVES